MKKTNKTEQKVLDWNQKFPCDRWWRDKYKIPFMSQAHKEISFLDQLFEYVECEIVEEYSNKKEANEYTPNQRDFIKFDENDKDSQIRSMAEDFKREFLEDQD